MNNDYLENYYNIYDEENRLLSKHGMVEYIYNKNNKILEIGAGTGRYSVTLSKEGYDVTAVELIKHNIDILNSKIDEKDNIK